MPKTDRHHSAPKAGHVQITLVVREGDPDPAKDRCGYAHVTVPAKDLEGLTPQDIATRYLAPSFVAARNALA